MTNEILEKCNLPRDRATFNAWFRSFAALNPVVSLTVEFYTSVLINNLVVSHDFPKRVEDVYQQIWELINLEALLNEYWIIGEAFPYMELDESTSNWRKMIIQNPDYISVKRSVIADDLAISLRPDEYLRHIVLKDTPENIKQREKLDPQVVKCVKDGENIPLNNFYITHLVRRTMPYEIRGTSILMGVVDKLRKNEMDNEVKQYLCYPHQGDIGNINLEVLRTRLRRAAHAFEDWLTRKVFAPIAKINEFNIMKDGENIPCIPTISFDINKALASVTTK